VRFKVEAAVQKTLSQAPAAEKNQSNNEPVFKAPQKKVYGTSEN